LFPLSIDELTEMGETFEAMSDQGDNVIAFSDVAIKENELGEELRQKLSKLEKMTQQLRKAEQGAGVKSSRLLRLLLKLASESECRNLTKPGIADLAKLYRCVHKGEGKVIWICDSKYALQRAKELGFLAPELRAVDSDVSDVSDVSDEDDEEQAISGDRKKDAKDETRKGASVSLPLLSKDSERYARTSRAGSLTAEFQDLKRRLSSLDMGVMGIGAAVSMLGARGCTPTEWIEGQIQQLAQHLDTLMLEADPGLLSIRAKAQLQQMGRQLGGLLVPLQGYLFKRATTGLKAKKKCFFKLLADKLVFFNTEAEVIFIKAAGVAQATDKHTFPLNDMGTVQPTADEGGKQFEIRHTSKKSWVLSANTAEEAREWVFRLQLAVASRSQRG
jgi:hypothetical protein